MPLNRPILLGSFPSIRDPQGPDRTPAWVCQSVVSRATDRSVSSRTNQTRRRLIIRLEWCNKVSQSLTRPGFSSASGTAIPLSHTIGSAVIVCGVGVGVGVSVGTGTVEGVEVAVAEGGNGVAVATAVGGGAGVTLGVVVAVGNAVGDGLVPLSATVQACSSE